MSADYVVQCNNIQSEAYTKLLWITILPPDCPFNLLPIKITLYHMYIDEFVRGRVSRAGTWWDKMWDREIPLVRNVILGYKSENMDLCPN